MCCKIICAAKHILYKIIFILKELLEDRHQNVNNDYLWEVG